MTQSEIEPATFRLVAQCLNQTVPLRAHRYDSLDFKLLGNPGKMAEFDVSSQRVCVLTEIVLISYQCTFVWAAGWGGE